MNYLFYDSITNEKAKVKLIYHVEPPTELKELPHIEVDDLKEPEYIEGKAPELYVNPTTKTYWYDYVDIPLTEEQMLRKRLELAENAIEDLILNGGGF